MQKKTYLLLHTTGYNVLRGKVLWSVKKSKIFKIFLRKKSIAIINELF